jgi:hypothetical protein
VGHRASFRAHLPSGIALTCCKAGAPRPIKQSPQIHPPTHPPTHPLPAQPRPPPTHPPTHSRPTHPPKPPPSFGPLSAQQYGQRGYDRVRGYVIGRTDVSLKYFEEAFTSQHWMMRIYRWEPQLEGWGGRGAAGAGRLGGRLEGHRGC